MKRRIVLLMGAISSLSASLSACLSGNDPSAAPEATRDPRWELFQQSAIKISDSPVRYVFGGDMLAVGDDGLRAAYERYFGSSPTASGGIGAVSSPLTVDQANGVDILLETNYQDSSGGRYHLTYCIQRNTFSAGELAALEPALDLAQDSWNGLVNVAFRHDASQDASCGAANTNVFFNVRNVSAGQFFASSFFPHDVRGARELLIDDSAFTTTANGRDLQGILRHEHGHMLGFRHEHIWLGNCTTEDLDDDFGSPVHVTPYDENSVMHYPQCRTSMSGGYRQSKLDYQGAIGLYGLAAAQIMNL
jgi:hypothetical protein